MSARPSAERGGRVRRTTSGLRSTRSMLVATASWFNKPAVALPTRSTMSGRRNTASSRVRRYGRSSRTSVSARICSWVISSALPNKRGDQRFAFDIPLRFAAPAPVPDLRVIVRRLAGPCDLVRRRCPRRVALDRKAHLPGRFDNRRPALRPVSDQVPGHACDARELSILAILFHADAETFLQAPGQVLR